MATWLSSRHDHHFQRITRWRGGQRQSLRKLFQGKPVRDQLGHRQSPRKHQLRRLLPGDPPPRYSCPESLFLPRRRRPRETRFSCADRFARKAARGRRAARARAPRRAATGRGTATSTTSAPRPSRARARSLSAKRPSAGSKAAVAPRRSLTARRSGIGSVVSTVAPASRASIISSRPMGPWPITSTVSPARRAAFSTALRQVFTGSTKVASSKVTSGGNFDHAAFDNPGHRAHVFGKAAAIGIKARGQAHFFVGGALREQARSQ